MAAYLIIDLDVLDSEAYRDSGYGEAVRSIVAEYGGRYLSAGGEHVVIEGDWRPTRLGIIEFPSMTALMGFSDSEAYQPWKELRQKLVRSNVVAVRGTD